MADSIEFQPCRGCEDFDYCNSLVKDAAPKAADSRDALSNNELGLNLDEDATERAIGLALSGQAFGVHLTLVSVDCQHEQIVVEQGIQYQIDHPGGTS